MNQTSVNRVEELFPRLKAKAYQMAQLLMLKGVDLEVSQGLRTWPEQTVLWQRGRNPDGSYIDPVHQSGVVTHAKAGESWHNYGCAFDIAIVTSYGLDWTGNDAAWQACFTAGESLGLTAGAEWQHDPDKPHFQLTGRFPMDKPDDEVSYLFKNGGLAAVWDEITKSLPA